MGTLQVGRNLLNSNDVWNLDPTGQQFMGSATLVQGRNWQGLSNAIEYTTPNMAGLTVNAQYGFGEKADNSKANRSEDCRQPYLWAIWRCAPSTPAAAMPWAATAMCGQAFTRSHHRRYLPLGCCQVVYRLRPRQGQACQGWCA
jgi:hypothetical protein